ncbi:hypothetical protein A1D30_07290 [Acidovorax sp. GW101-3H11]|uniref:hypothetical protein n=1 Tax=Acidovorax sp. GW101-3H11 TaxID=1813946 RepID=UPI0007B52D86|nr:hypothetical protein [Acidovorax sp. GW101-3H11]KZT16946.1 hypothetical protein A1D30_07290 [Acidovorax sp. GW101-3H11]
MSCSRSRRAGCEGGGGTGAACRWRKFTHEQIKARGGDLDIGWLKDDSAETVDAQHDEPALVARMVMRELNAAMADLRTEVLGGADRANMATS